ncbi:MAG: beta-ketoacyl-ACP synthase [Alphaproteobacteria bacterium]
MREVWITGIGLVSSLGDGPQAHWDHLSAGAKPVTAPANHLPDYHIHPVVEVDYSTHIPRRGDQRQMGPWQRLGVYAAGQALADAGIAGLPEYCDITNMVVAAGGGERDIDVDNEILNTLKTTNTPDSYLNTAMMNELRPTLFLAQLPNLLAGNISIVHKVTGSSRTFMGEEPAGVCAVEVAYSRIRAGQGDLFLVGAANNADRAEMALLLELAHKLWPGTVAPVWARGEKGGGIVSGSVGAFLVLESAEHARARKAKPYASLSAIATQRQNWSSGHIAPVDPAFAAVTQGLRPGHLAVLSGASGAEPATADERQFLADLETGGNQLAVRTTGTMLGHSLEAQFPAGLALAALAISKGTLFPPFDDTGFEAPSSGSLDRALITSWGHWHGKGLALLEKPE